MSALYIYIYIYIYIYTKLALECVLGVLAVRDLLGRDQRVFRQSTENRGAIRFVMF